MALARLSSVLLLAAACGTSGSSVPGSTETDATTGASDPSSTVSATGDPCAIGAIGNQDLMSITHYPLHYTGVDGAMTFANDDWSNPPGALGDQFEWHGIGMGAGLVRFSRTHDYDPLYIW
jgi:hypothetical protein